ncbi:protein spaetzle 4 isoform X1 [Cataglyphis hispanica]|uniref:protein spaetzle 4 isoform X1 n=1 Tax=Cataglyphis hispanica TaxID=1086592 RepID=UPI002180326E|nr:protein spaetzle 4 isoform X1 [Cataglyphis hispanica]XP_050455044.1 protein spaetzle 4 isoform X1 [Cataglyphis hispanica]XP_050455045.1 protein spaetzle 4 isoform X1 [Cataglyphis hispanica]
MRAIAPFVFQVIALQLTKCQGSGGGPSTFGYDASSACSKPYSRAGRAHHEDLPCDFRRQNWCTIAGSAYPWHAVRRFVQENQGLMRRMYGDESYISILRAEFEKNDIEFKYDEYYHHFADDIKQFQYEDDYEVMDDDQSKLNADDENREFTSRSFNDPVAKRLNKFPKLSEYTRPHFRPTERTTSSTASSTKILSSTLSSTSTTTSATTFDTHTSSSTTPISNTTVTNMDEKREEIKTQSLITSASPKFSNTTVEIADNGDVAVNITTTTALPSITMAQIVREQNFSINEIPGQNDRIDEDLEELGEVIAHSEEITIKEDTTLKSIDTGGTTTSVFVSTESLINRDEEAEVLDVATKTTVHEEIIAATSHEQQQFRPRPEYRPTSVAESSASVSGQLYQDVAAKDHHEQPVLKLRGINACPVKEEVVAPFWANNTRGEVLALLNLYPFEQYVHWEKCTHENKQMYCRDGCRCEQQYRLHRLLAYDPNNECRGIFSDWFKFPSCCVCRCYDLPLEFRVTSRSPRTSRKRRIKVQPPTRDRYQ